MNHSDVEENREKARDVPPQAVAQALRELKVERNPERRRVLEQRVLRLMPREEPLAEQVVNHLLHER